LCYCAIVLLCYCAIVLLCYCAIVLLCYCAIVLFRTHLSLLLSLIVIVISLWFFNNSKLCVESRAAYRVLVGSPEGKRLLGRSRQRREDNIKIDLQRVGCGGTDWIKLAQGRDR